MEALCLSELLLQFTSQQVVTSQKTWELINTAVGTLNIFF